MTKDRWAFALAAPKLDIANVKTWSGPCERPATQTTLLSAKYKNINRLSVRANPTVSVIIPTYSKPEYLRECLFSIKNQTYPNWECIVVSDGSPRLEEVRTAVEAMRDERFRLIELSENRGPAAARNTGVREAVAENYIWVDEDDVLAEECLARLIEVMHDTEAAIVRPHIALIGKETRIPRIRVPSREEALVRPGLYSVGFLVKKMVFDTVGMLDENPALFWGLEDVEWWIRVIWAGLRIEVVEDALYWYRPADSYTEKKCSQHFRGMLHATEIGRYIVRKHQDKYDKYPDKKREFLLRCYNMQIAAEAENMELWAALLHAIVRLRYEPNVRNLRTAAALGKAALISVAGHSLFRRMRGHS